MPPEIKRRPYWLDSGPEMPSYSGRPVPERADVAVIGAGITGLSTALHLAKKGAQVIVLEKETIGWGASSRNGGQCNPGLTISPEMAIRRFGLAEARRQYQVSLDAVDYVETLVQAESIDCEFNRCGRLGVAYKPAHFNGLRSRQALLAKEFGHETVLVSPNDLQQEIGSDYYHGGLVDPQGARLHPMKFTAGLAAAAQRAGAEIHEKLPALTIKNLGNDGFRIQTARADIQVKQVMLATNGYTDAISPKIKRRVLPIGSFIIGTEPLSAALAQEISPRRRNIVDTKNYSYFLRLSADNRMLFGGRARFALSNPEVDRNSGEILLKGMRRVFPQLNDTQLEYVWGGTVAFTLDRLPHAGQMDSIHYAMGYCGHGVQNATYMGKQMAEVIDGSPESNPWAEIPFPAVPYAFGWTWLLPLAGAYYKFLDWLT